MRAHTLSLKHILLISIYCPHAKQALVLPLTLTDSRPCPTSINLVTSLCSSRSSVCMTTQNPTLWSRLVGLLTFTQHYYKQGNTPKRIHPSDIIWEGEFEGFNNKSGHIKKVQTERGTEKFWLHSKRTLMEQEGFELGLDIPQGISKN